jgi:23S rRNA pseudouridine2605 synthase
VKERLQKFLSRAGVASRRAAEVMIAAGRVKVNNLKVTEMGTQVESDRDLVTVDGKPVSLSEERTYLMFYKPPGVVTTLSDPQGRKTITDFLSGSPGRVYPVGRLDYDAEGALILTSDGELANHLTHPRYQVQRVYLAKVKGEPEDEALDRLRGGVRLEDGDAKPLSVEVFEHAERNTWLKIVVAEGRPHLIKRMCAAIGHPVVRLFRPSHAGIGLDGLQPGRWRKLSEEEVAAVWEVARGAPAQIRGLRLPARRHGRSDSGGDDDETRSPKPLPRSHAGRKPSPARPQKETRTIPSSESRSGRVPARAKSGHGSGNGMSDAARVQRRAGPTAGGSAERSRSTKGAGRPQARKSAPRRR